MSRFKNDTFIFIKNYADQIIKCATNLNVSMGAIAGAIAEEKNSINSTDTAQDLFVTDFLLYTEDDNPDRVDSVRIKTQKELENEYLDFLNKKESESKYLALINEYLDATNECLDLLNKKVLKSKYLALINEHLALINESLDFIDEYSDKLISFYNKVAHIMANDIGPANINVATAIQLLRDYVIEYPLSDPLALKYLANDYAQLVRDLVDETSHVVAAITTLMIKEADTFYSQKAVLAWNLYDQTIRDGICITYFNNGRNKSEEAFKNLQEKLESNLISEFGQVILPDGQSFGFPQHFPFPGGGESGGLLYLENKAELLNSLGREEKLDPQEAVRSKNLLAFLGAILNSGNIEHIENLEQLQNKINSDNTDNSYLTSIQQKIEELLAGPKAWKDLFDFTYDKVILGDDDFGNIEGAFYDDRIFGYGGNDVLIGVAGSDQLYGGADDDQLYGDYDTENKNKELSDYGDDLLNGGTGINKLYGGRGYDTYQVGKGQDYILDTDNQGYVQWYNEATKRYYVLKEATCIHVEPGTIRLPNTAFK